MLISYEDAYFYKLLLQTGFKKEANEWIDNIAINSEKLEGISLDLVCSQGDTNNVISCLHNFIGDNKINNENLHCRLRNFIKDKFYLKEITMREVAVSLSSFAIILDKMNDEFWSDFYLIGEYYDLVEDRILDSNQYYTLVTNYLQNGENLDPGKFWKNNAYSFKNIFLQEKKEMNPIRFKINYILVPIYLVTMIILFTIIGITMSIDEEKYNLLAIVLFSIFGIISLALLMSVPIIRKKEVKIELAKYDFTIDDTEKDQYIVISIEGVECIFNKTGLMINEVNYNYDDFYIDLYTTNYLITVRINVEFVLIESNDDVAPYWNFRLNKSLLNAIIKYNIKISNQEVLEYIINNKKEAFDQILTYGYIKSIKKKER